APDPERMLAMRRRVLAEVAATERSGPILRLGWAFGAALVALAILSLWPREARLDLTTVNIPAPDLRPPAFAFDLTPPTPARRPAPPTRERATPKIELVGLNRSKADGEPDGHLLKIGSSDPNVIIYYLLETTGDSL